MNELRTVHLPLLALNLVVMAMLAVLELQPPCDEALPEDASPDELYLFGLPSAFTSLPLSQLDSKYCLLDTGHGLDASLRESRRPYIRTSLPFPMWLYSYHAAYSPWLPLAPLCTVTGGRHTRGSGGAADHKCASGAGYFPRRPCHHEHSFPVGRATSAASYGAARSKAVTLFLPPNVALPHR